MGKFKGPWTRGHKIQILGLRSNRNVMVLSLFLNLSVFNFKMWVIKKMQIKTTMRYYLTPIRMATIKNTEITSVGENVKKLEPRALLVGM